MIESLEELVLFLRRYHCYTVPADSSLIPPEFPPQLDKFYSELGGLIEVLPSPENNHRAPFSGQDSIRPIEAIRYVDEMVEFADENQGNWSCRCPFSKDDPPVYSNAEETWGDRTGFHIVCESLTHFLTTLALQETVMGSSILLAVDENAASEKFVSSLPPIWLDGIYVFGEPSHQFHFSDEFDMLAMSYEGNGLWFGSNDLDLCKKLPDHLMYSEL